jgi:hypothetical protein
MGTFFIYESNNKFEMYQYGLSRWIDIVKTGNARVKMYSLGAAFLIATILVLIFFKSFPEWFKGIALILMVMSATSLISKLALSENVLVINNDLEPDIAVIDQQIEEQKKRLELARLEAETNKLKSEGITKQLLQQQFIEKWDGKTPLYGTTPVTLFKQTN